MAELFKDVFNHQSISQLADFLHRADQCINRDGFYSLATQNLETHELKQRSQQIVVALVEYLPQDFEQAAQIILASLDSQITDHQDWTQENTQNGNNGVSGWLIMPLADYVGLYGQDHFDTAMSLFYHLTQRFSAEFGIRHFLLAMPQKTLKRLEEWTTDESVHVRRLVSEGTRPTLPWGLKLNLFFDNPSYTYPLLEALRDDSEEYVRRSVANHINDFSKKHPDWTTDLIERWLKDAPNTRTKLLKHASRTLFKQGHPKVLNLFGFSIPQLSDPELSIENTRVEYGKGLTFSFSARSSASKSQQWMVDYVIYHKKANGQLTPKVFKWKSVTINPDENIQWTRFHAMKPITTRKYYDGEHKVAIVINGQEKVQSVFYLLGAN